MKGRGSDSESSIYEEKLKETQGEEGKAYKGELKNRERQTHKFS